MFIWSLCQTLYVCGCHAFQHNSLLVVLQSYALSRKSPVSLQSLDRHSVLVAIIYLNHRSELNTSKFLRVSTTKNPGDRPGQYVSYIVCVYKAFCEEPLAKHRPCTMIRRSECLHSLGLVWVKRCLMENSPDRSNTDTFCSCSYSHTGSGIFLHSSQYANFSKTAHTSVAIDFWTYVH
jgi:hypothetical protein